MKAIIKRYLRRSPRLYELARDTLWRLSRDRARRNRAALRQRIRDAVADRAGVFFVQVGSNDGVTSDPIRPLIEQHVDWRGLLIEPVPYLFDRLKSNCSDSNRFCLENAAVAMERGTLPFYYVAEEAARALPDLPRWYDQIGSFDRQHIVDRLNGRLEPFIVKQHVVCLPLADILAKHNVKQIDLLHIDTEGYDYRVLAQVDFDAYRPAAILFEYKHLPAADQRRASNLLSAAGYTLLDCGGDTLALSAA